MKVIDSYGKQLTGRIIGDSALCKSLQDTITSLKGIGSTTGLSWSQHWATSFKYPYELSPIKKNCNVNYYLTVSKGGSLAVLSSEGAVSRKQKATFDSAYLLAELIDDGGFALTPNCKIVIF